MSETTTKTMTTNNSTTATLQLFKAIWIQDHKLDSTQQLNDEHKLAHKKLLEQTLPYGYILDPRIEASKIDSELLKIINQQIGLSSEQANQAFHKSWQTIADSTHEQLFIQQITHYITTYGFENMGIYDEDSVYIPNEVLDAPEISIDALNLQIIKPLTTQELSERVLTLASGIALATETLDDLQLIIRELFMTPDYSDNQQAKNEFVSKIANRELNTRLLDEFNIVPTEPVAFLRHVIYQLTETSLLIKNNRLIFTIKSYAEDEQAIAKMDQTMQQAPKNLASIFLRYKPLFLALKSISKNKTLFNQLRKQAKTQHKPLPVDYFNNITNAIKTNTLDMNVFSEKLTQATVYRKIRLANALRYRLNLTDSAEKHSIVYRVRNGRGWATEFTWQQALQAQTEQAYNAVVAAIAADMRANVEGKTFYLPANVNYTLPATEKQFTGNFPTGSWITVADNLIVGIHWENVQSTKNNSTQRIDLDLSLVGMSGTKIGWDASYKKDNNSMIFSGDVTDAPAPQGATELFYIQKGLKEAQALFVNYFNHSSEYPVPCKFMVANEKAENFDLNYVVDPNHILMQTQIHLTEKQNMLGLINTVNNENRIYFANMNVGANISAYGGGENKHAQQYLLNISENVLMLREVLEMAGATVLDVMPEASKDTEKATTKQSGLFTNIVNLIVDGLGKTAEKANKQNNDKQANEAPSNNEHSNEEEQNQTIEIIDLSPAKVDKTTFIELLQQTS